MTWTTVALIAIAAVVALGLIVATAWVLIARAAVKNFERARERSDEAFHSFYHNGRF